jgi:hypothetical protein
MVVMGVMLAGSVSAQDDNPFAYKDAPKVEATEAAAPVVNSDLSDAQREQVLALLTRFLSDSGLNTGDSIYDIGDGKRYFVVPDEDKFVGEISGKFIIFDTSRDRNLYVDAADYDEVISQKEHEELSKEKKEAIVGVGERLINGMTSSVSETFKEPAAPKSITIGDRNN